MKEILFTIGLFTIYGYGLMIALGVVAAFGVGMYREKKLGIGEDQIFSLGIWCLVCGWLAAKILFLITEIPSLIADPKHFLSTLTSGFVVYGGLIGGIFTGWMYCRIKKLPFLKYFDLVMPSIALAQAFGRLGCLMAGCCYGRETAGAFHIVFPESCNYAPGGVPLVPTQLISSAANFLNFFALIFCAKKTKSDGQVGGLYLIFYSIGRFIIECFRADPRGTVGPLSTSQFIAIFMLAAGIAVFVYCGKKYPKDREEDETATDSTNQVETKGDSEEQTGIKRDSAEQAETKGDSTEQVGTKNDNAEQTEEKGDGAERTETKGDSAEQTGTSADGTGLPESEPEAEAKPQDKEEAVEEGEAEGGKT